MCIGAAVAYELLRYQWLQAQMCTYACSALPRAAVEGRVLQGTWWVLLVCWQGRAFLFSKQPLKKECKVARKRRRALVLLWLCMWRGLRLFLQAMRDHPAPFAFCGQSCLWSATEGGSSQLCRVVCGTLGSFSSFPRCSPWAPACPSLPWSCSRPLVGCEWTNSRCINPAINLKLSRCKTLSDSLGKKQTNQPSPLNKKQEEIFLLAALY